VANQILVYSLSFLRLSKSCLSFWLIKFCRNISSSLSESFDLFCSKMTAVVSSVVVGSAVV
jgi:hypothetical protein